MRRTLVAAGLTAALLGGTSLASAETITIATVNNSDMIIMQNLSSQWEEDTGNSIEWVVLEENVLRQRVTTDIATGGGQFDIITIGSYEAPIWGEQGWLVAVDDFGDDYDYDDIFESVREGLSHDGTLYAVPFYAESSFTFYRSDLFEEAGLSAPATWAEVEAAAQVLHNPPSRVGLVTRTAPTDWEFQSYLRGYGASVIEVDDSGQWRVGIADDDAVAALERYIQLNRDYGPGNYASVSQAEALSLMQSGRAAMAHVVGAAAPNFENPEQSIVQGLVQATIVPGPTADSRATMSGIWVMGIPENLPDARKQAALEFMRWALTFDAQMLYARAGAIPVRQDVYETLGQEEGFAWMQAMADSTPFIQAQPRVAEAPQIITAFAEQVAAALLGQVSAEQALQTAASEIHRIMVAGGYDVAPLD